MLQLGIGYVIVCSNGCLQRISNVADTVYVNSQWRYLVAIRKRSTRAVLSSSDIRIFVQPFPLNILTYLSTK